MNLINQMLIEEEELELVDKLLESEKGSSDVIEDILHKTHQKCNKYRKYGFLVSIVSLALIAGTIVFEIVSYLKNPDVFKLTVGYTLLIQFMALFVGTVFGYSGHKNLLEAQKRLLRMASDVSQ